MSSFKKELEAKARTADQKAHIARMDVESLEEHAKQKADEASSLEQLARDYRRVAANEPADTDPEDDDDIPF